MDQKNFKNHVLTTFYETGTLSTTFIFNFLLLIYRRYFPEQLQEVPRLFLTL